MSAARDTQNQTQLVEQVFAMTREIEHATSLADWQRAALITEQRSPLLMAISAQQEPASLALIRRIQAIDNATLENAKTTQVELEVEYRAAMDRTRAVSEYHRAAFF